jgi:hypothetical protein
VPSSFRSPHGSQSRQAKRAAAFLFALVFALVAAGCHRNNLNSGYGIGWITLTDEPGDFAAYIVQVDSVVLTGVANGEVTVLDIPETVDFTKLKNVAELWGSASIPNDTYTNAIITIDYTSADISVVVNGAPQQAKVVDSSGAAVTTISVTVNLDPTNQAYIIPTYATTSGIRLAIDFDLAASNLVNLATSPATVTVSPFFTIATSASDQKPILVRGPLVNTSVGEQTYSVYIRPFFDEVNTAGTLTMFNSASPTTPQCPQTPAVYTINGTAYSDANAITELSQTSAGSTMTLASTTYVPSVTPSATAAIFCVNYMIGGSTLEDFYTYGLEGDVIARNGNTLTVRGPTLFLNADEIVSGLTADYHVLLGTGTLITQDGLASDANLNYESVSVGQHITARGICTLTSIVDDQSVAVDTCASTNGYPTLDSTGTSATNTGSVRIQPTQFFGSLVSTGSGSLTMDLQGINQYPASVYDFTGTGTSAATDAVPASYVVNTASLAVPADLTAGGPVWVDGVVGPFGSAPPDVKALDVEDEVSEPATLIFTYTTAGVGTGGFSALSAGGIALDLSNPKLVSAVIRIGAEDIDVTTLPVAPTIVPQIVPAPPPPIKVATTGLTTADLPPTFLPLFCVGSTVNGISCFNTFATFVDKLYGEITGSAATSVVKFDARGTYNRTTNTFTAATANAVL